MVAISINTPGAYAFELQPGSSLTIDGLPVGGQALELVPGNHLLVLSGASSPDLTWRPPDATAFEPIDPGLLFGAPQGGNGLQATFYPTQDFTG